MLFQAFAIKILLFCISRVHIAMNAPIRLTNDIQLLMCCLHLLSDDGKIKTCLDPSILWQPRPCLLAVEMRGLEPLTSSLQRRRSPD